MDLYLKKVRKPYSEYSSRSSSKTHLLYTYHGLIATQIVNVNKMSSSNFHQIKSVDLQDLRLFWCWYENQSHEIFFFFFCQLRSLNMALEKVLKKKGLYYLNFLFKCFINLFFKHPTECWMFSNISSINWPQL